ncbi:MAG: hypothetical protein AAF456_18375 [Planctomycetota bacterium]
MKYFLYTTLLLGLVLLGVVYVLPILQRPGADALVEKALTATDEREQVRAARDLVALGNTAQSGLRQLMSDSTNESVVSVAIAGAAELYDYDSMDLIIDKLDDPSLEVRTAAGKATTGLLGRDHHFPAGGSEVERARIKAQIEEDWQSYNGSELFEFNRNRLGN